MDTKLKNNQITSEIKADVDPDVLEALIEKKLDELSPGGDKWEFIPL